MFNNQINFDILFLIAGIVIFLFTFFIIKKHLSFFLQSRPSRFFYYTVIFSSGFFLGIYKFKLLSDINFFINLFSGILLINILFLSSIILNNIFDKNIDKLNSKPNPLINIINIYDYIKIFWICFLSSLFISLSINYTTLIMTAIIHFISYIYSCPPLHIKKTFPLNIILIALSSVMALFLGVSSSNEYNLFFQFPYKLGLVILIVLSLAFNVKDINDFKGDKKYNVKTLMTILGYNYGRKIIGILAFSGYILLPLLLNFYAILLYSFIFGALTFFIIYKSKNKINENIIFLIFFIYLFIFIIHKPVLF